MLIIEYKFMYLAFGQTLCTKARPLLLALFLLYGAYVFGAPLY